MFIKVLVVLASVLYLTNGTPLQPKRLDYDPRSFLSPRIVGGVDAPEGYGRHMAALIFGHNIIYFICGGFIVTKRHVLTAAHCIDSMVVEQELYPSFRAVIGAKKWYGGANEVLFEEFIVHHGWNWDTIKYDIGVLKTTEDIKSSETVAIAPINYDWIDGGKRSYVTGWGRLEVWGDVPYKLQLLYVNTLSHEQCREAMRRAMEDQGPAPPVQEDIELCTLHSPGNGMCNGDSGSPLILEETQEVIGIVSWGFPCAQGIPDVFVRVSGFRDWLDNIIGDLQTASHQSLL